MHFQFALIAFVLAVSFGFADDNLDETKAIEKLRLLGVGVTRDETLRDRPVIGAHYYKPRQKFGEKYLHLLKAFPNLTTLNLLYPMMITDAGLKEVGELQSLTSLKIFQAPIADDGLKELRVLKNLQALSIVCEQNRFTTITDAGVKHVIEHANLTAL